VADGPHHPLNTRAMKWGSDERSATSCVEERPTVVGLPLVRRRSRRYPALTEVPSARPKMGIRRNSGTAPQR
jgi:hypothetical protein